MQLGTSLWTQQVPQEETVPATEARQVQTASFCPKALLQERIQQQGNPDDKQDAYALLAYFY